jgi:hypothetical protein
MTLYHKGWIHFWCMNEITTYNCSLKQRPGDEELLAAHHKTRSIMSIKSTEDPAEHSKILLRRDWEVIQQFDTQEALTKLNHKICRIVNNFTGVSTSPGWWLFGASWSIQCNTGCSNKISDLCRNLWPFSSGWLFHKIGSDKLYFGHLIFRFFVAQSLLVMVAQVSNLQLSKIVNK